MANFLAEVGSFLYRKWLIVTSMGGRTRKSSRLVEVRNWEDLTTDCLINIFERLGLESLILDIPFVCKSWYKVSLDPHCWKVLDFQFMSLKRSPWAITVVEEKSWSGIKHSNATPSTKFMKIAVNRSDGLATKLVFHTCIFYDNILEYVLERCPALKTLILPAADLVGYYNCYFDDLTKKNNKCILKMISKLKNLESLMNLWSLPGCQFKKLLKQIHIHCPNFESLGFRNSFSDDVASAIVTLAPNIKHLVLRDSTVHRENLILILSGCRKLELLDATNYRGFDVDDTEILKMASHLILKVPNHGFLSRAAEKWWLSY